MYRGGIYLDFSDDIGDNIDLVILDTMHVLPGEVLDFLTIFPALHKGSVVILHDIRLNHSNNEKAFATKLLFDTVVADKIIEETDSFEKYPNIAAFIINDDTTKYIRDVFSALTITWEYVPEERHVEIYKHFFEKSYSQNMYNIFVTSLGLNRRTVSKRVTDSSGIIVDLYNILNTVRNKNTYIYGCGKYGKIMYEFLNKVGIAVEGFIVSNSQNLDQNAPLEVKHVADVVDKEAMVIVALSALHTADVKIELEKHDINNVIFVDREVIKLISTGNF